MCAEHWTRLRKEVEDSGMTHLVSRSGKEAFDKIVAPLTEPASPRNGADDFDPLMGANFSIWGAALKDGGLAMMVGDKCPLCECCRENPGLDEDWIKGSVADELNHARQLGLMPKVQ